MWKDPAFADRLEKEAADLKRRFNRDFWVEDGEYFAVALDADGRQVDSLTSNIGHLLWSGIVDKSKAKAVARHLMGPRLFSGWGVRTLAEGEARTTPSATTWARCGRSTTPSSPGACAATASRTRPRHRRRGSSRRPRSSTGGCRGVRRLPAELDHVPGAVPDGLQPAGMVYRGAAAAAAHRLGLEPNGDHLIVDPALPKRIGNLELLDLPGRWKRIDAFGRGRIDTDRIVRR